ncbi:MAG: hypothetical protein AB1490_18565 [Pseudomonadota bacterium]
MSRRIALSIVAAYAALSLTPAFADNDCFDQTTCPPAEETLAREQRMLEERTRELREQEAQAAAEALAQQRAEEQRAQELAAQEAAARAQAAETQRAMERAAAEQAKREEAAAARATQDDAAHEQQYAKEREAEEQRAAERRAQQLRAAEQQRMPNLVEPPAVVVQVPAAAEASQAAQAPKEAAAPMKEPVVAVPLPKEPTKQPTILSNVPGIVPPVSTVPPKKIARPAERYEEPARAQKPAKRVAETPRPQPAPAVQSAPSAYEEPREPVRVVQRAPLITGSVPVQSPVVSAPIYVNQGPPAGTIVIVKGATYEDGVTPAVTDVRPDPSMKFCQTEQRADGRYVYCNQGSYHPYGVNGYRPLGTYKAYRSTPAYIATAPDARIISLRSGD